MNASNETTIVFLDFYDLNPGDLDMKPFEGLGKIICYGATEANKVVERSKEADIIVSNKVVINQNVLQQLPRLKMICVSATGYNEVDIDVCRQRGIIVSNAPGYSTPSVAQAVFAHILNLVSIYIWSIHLNCRWKVNNNLLILCCSPSIHYSLTNL